MQFSQQWGLFVLNSTFCYQPRLKEAMVCFIYKQLHITNKRKKGLSSLRFLKCSPNCNYLNKTLMPDYKTIQVLPERSRLKCSQGIYLTSNKIYIQFFRGWNKHHSLADSNHSSWAFFWTHLSSYNRISDELPWSKLKWLMRNWVPVGSKKYLKFMTWMIQVICNSQE